MGWPLETGRTETGNRKVETGKQRVISQIFRLGRGFGVANGASKSACFFFERSDTELDAGLTIVQILADPLFETATAFALRNVHKIVQEQFAIAPGIGANDDGMAKSDATRVRGNDLRTPRGLRQFAALRQRNSIDDQNSDALKIANPGKARIGLVLRT